MLAYNLFCSANKQALLYVCTCYVVLKLKYKDKS